ncbi:MAG: hypothetical protein HWE10_01225 [Gammaproteobacteria bacterium]|nr:hypothetical protein [Gammaproteobacteria bacterium]
MKYIHSIVLALFVAALAGCSSTSPEEKLAKQQQQNKIFAARVAESKSLMDKLEARIKQSQTDNLKYFAPKKLEDALEAYKDAKEDYDEIAIDKTEATQSQVADIKEYVFKANTALDAANVIKQNAETILVESFDIRNELKALNAPNLKAFSRSYDRLSGDIDEIVEEIADGDLEDARSENGKLLPKLRALEVSVVQYIELSDAKARLDSLKSQRATRYAPNSYQQAASSIQLAEAGIATNVRDKEKIKEIVAQATFQLERTSNILQAVQELARIKSDDRESYITRFENQLLNISKALADKDLRNKPLVEQTNEIVALIERKNNRIDNIKSSAEESSEEAERLVAEAQSKAKSLAAKLSNTEQMLKSQVDENLELKQQVADLQVQALENEKRILELQNAALQDQNEALANNESSTEQAPATEAPIAETAVEATETATDSEQEDADSPTP